MKTFSLSRLQTKYNRVLDSLSGGGKKNLLLRRVQKARENDATLYICVGKIFHYLLWLRFSYHIRPTASEPLVEMGL